MSRSSSKSVLGLKIFEQRVGQPLELEDGRPPRLLSTTLYVISYAIIGAVIWAAIVEVREVSSAKGELIPVGKIQSVQHFEGGIVDDVLVQSGDEVKKGDPIIRLRPRLVSSDLNQLKARLNWLELGDVRLAAELSGQKPDFSPYEVEYPDLVTRQTATYAADINEKTKVQNMLDMRILSRKSEVDALSNELGRRQDELATHREIFRMQSGLVTKGHTSKRNYLESKVTFQRARTSLAAAKFRLAEVKKELTDAIGEREKTIAETRKEITTQRAKITEERLVLTHQLDKHSDRFDRLFVRAPISGFVKQVVPKGHGSVVQPGQLIAEIVPNGQNLIAEVKIQPRDIGHVKIGDFAELIVTTYDINIHGKISGSVTNISASSFKDESGEPYFRGEIAFDRQGQEGTAARLRLMSGMIVEANIVTGSKSILRYLLKPIYRSIDVAFSER